MLFSYTRFLGIMYSILLLSIFIDLRIYPLLMIFLGIVGILNMIILKNNIKIKSYQLISIILIIYCIFSFFYTPNYEIKRVNTFKFLISFFYFSTFEFLFESFGEKKYRYFFKIVLKTLKVIILLNFIQIIYIYLSNNLDFNLFYSLNSSSKAYAINFNNNFMFLGNENKNIWSSKTAIVYVLYFFVEKKIMNRKLNKIIFFIANLSILLLLSRTGILFILTFYFLFYINNFIKMKIKNKIGVAIIGIIPMYVFLKKVLNKIFRIGSLSQLKLNFKSGIITDGGLTRIFNWNIFLKNFFYEEYFIGVGLGGTKSFLIKYGTILADGHMHNVILNMFLELGIIGGSIYTLLLIKMFLVFKRKKLLSLYLSFLVVLMLQYMGYDNDVVIYWSFMIILSKIPKIYTYIQ